MQEHLKRLHAVWVLVALTREKEIRKCSSLSFGLRAGLMGIGDENDQVSKGHLVDALACTGDEGRDTLR